MPYVDYPEIRIDEHESTEMPFRYVKDAQGKPVMPEVSRFPCTDERGKVFLLLLLMIRPKGDARSDQEGLGERVRGLVLNPKCMLVVGM